MSDKALRKALIRVAHANPGPVRDALLPLLIPKRAAFKLSPADRKVLDAFIDKKSAESKKLSTNGKVLDGLWMGGKGVAQWEGGKIQLQETGGKSGDTIHKAIRKMAPRNLVASQKQARLSTDGQELMLFIENDGQLYRSSRLPITNNLLRKWRKGQFDLAKAAKGFLYMVDEGAKKYHAEFGTPGLPWHKAFPKAVRLEVAKAFADEFLEEAEAGGYD